ncbi:TPA: hypothetical protein RUU14_005086, partial [Escherichia coli]|nr:hypothetical protein [Escherichia coli]
MTETDVQPVKSLPSVRSVTVLLINHLNTDTTGNKQRVADTVPAGQPLPVPAVSCVTVQGHHC